MLELNLLEFCFDSEVYPSLKVTQIINEFNSLLNIFKIFYLLV